MRASGQPLAAGYTLPMSRHGLVLVEPPVLSPAEKLRAALELQVVGVALKRRALRRAHPEASDEELNERLFRWRARLE